MALSVSPNVIVYVCHRSIPQGALRKRQWRQDGVQVVVREVPCSGKMDGQYLMHALEGGARGICVIACPKGECRLSQGNYRAEIRIHTIQRLLGELGIEPERAELINFSASDPADRLDEAVRQSVARICALGKSPVSVEQ
jgi:F420-non-reducing hydrogenase iron-sulfur subunit